jgi:hypothetical protein
MNAKNQLRGSPNDSLPERPHAFAIVIIDLLEARHTLLVLDRYWQE